MIRINDRPAVRPRRRAVTALASLLAAGAAIAPGRPAAGQLEDAVRELNSDPKTVAGTEASKSYRLLFDAYLDLGAPPTAVGARFNLRTIHPGMDDWSQVAAWAESHAAMADAVIASRDRNMVGLPYGPAEDARYRQAGLVAEIGVDGSMRHNRFTYLDAVDTIAAFVAAETYRRHEAGEHEAAIELTLAHLFVVRQFCDRDFLEEKLRTMELLIDSLSVCRDQMFTYIDQIPVEQFRQIGWYELPFLAVDRNHLFMPEGDRRVALAMIEAAFDDRGRGDPDKFVEIFAGIQAEREPLTRFGAARRWKMIATVHDSQEASLDRLTTIYDDWWRRWRVQAWDPILDIKPEFERTNEVRYAAVLYSIRDIRQVFTVRHRLLVAAHGTTMAAALCGRRPREDLRALRPRAVRRRPVRQGLRPFPLPPSRRADCGRYPDRAPVARRRAGAAVLAGPELRG
jgi:hypothetical protein